MSCTAIVARRHQVDCVVCVSGGRHHYRFQFLFCAVALATSLRVVLPALATAFHRAGCCILRRRGIATFRNAATPATFWMIPFSLRKAAQATPLSRGSFILFFYIMMPLSGVPQLEVSFSSLESGAANTPFWKFLCFLKSYHDALFRSTTTPVTFQNFPLFPSRKQRGLLHVTPATFEKFLFSLESSATRIPLSGGYLFLFYHNTMLTFRRAGELQNP